MIMRGMQVVFSSRFFVYFPEAAHCSQIFLSARPLELRAKANTKDLGWRRTLVGPNRQRID